MRPSRRQPDELRAVSLERGVVKYAEGSCFVKFGDTHVLVTATLEDRLPPWLKGQARGWVTAEYGMLPRATLERTRREASAGKQSGRTVEIQRLIGRSLRAVVDLQALGERQITVDCDVIQADGGTRTAAITGAWVALHDCIAWMKTREMLKAEPLRDHVAAISCGICNGVAVLDLDYAEDSEAETDANFVMTGAGHIVEVQGTAEKTPFTEEQLLGAAGARAQRHRQAGRPAEAGGDVSGRAAHVHEDAAGRHRRITGRLVIATHNPGKLARCASCWRPTASRRSRRASSASPSRGDRHEVSRQCAHQGGGGGASVRPAGLRRRFRARGRCARRRSPASTRRAGPEPTRTFAAPCETVEDLLRERGALTAATAPRAFRLGAVRRLAGRACRGVRGPRRRHAGVAAARHRRLRLRSDVPARRPYAHLRRDDERGEARRCRRAAKACRTARAPSSSSRRRALSER